MGFREKKGIILLDIKVFITLALRFRDEAVEGGTTDQIVEEDGEERVEKLWGVRRFPIYPVPIVSLEAKISKLGEAICTTPIFKWLESHMGAQGFTVEDIVRQYIYCVSLSGGLREFGLN
jgi:hypothetical protein